jgi:Spy/CpxP family protein refolding chaperone
MKRHHEAFLGIWQHPKTIQELKLTDEQVKKLKEADFARRENCLQLKSKLDGFHLEMEKLFAADSVNETKVIQLAQKISDAKGELFVERIKSRLTLIDLLTEDQLSKLKKYDWCPHDKHGKRLTNRKHHRSSFNRGDKN